MKVDKEDQENVDKIRQAYKNSLSQESLDKIEAVERLLGELADNGVPTVMFCMLDMGYDTYMPWVQYNTLGALWDDVSQDDYWKYMMNLMGAFERYITKSNLPPASELMKFVEEQRNKHEC